ncbi:MAG: c-type cytochrome [Opitutus sp.]|nr:c-type cytochrome [Opitutus sp.]
MTSHLARIVTLLAGLMLGAASAAEPYRPVDTQTSGQPLPAQEALARMRLSEGFKITLAAAEPDIRQPIALAYDERGRLWVAESYSYNGSDFTDERHDRIVIFEDKDGDGVFESRRVFHDGLNRLTGLAVGFGGVWVTTPPYLAFIPDRNRDDLPDGAPEVHLDGWTLKAEHNSVNGLTWGPDGWLYGRHGIKEPSRPGRPGRPAAERAEVSCAVWRYHPVRQVFEVVAEGTINPWGLDFDEHGQIFISTSVVDHLWHVVPGAKFKRWVGREIPLYPHLYDLMGPVNDHSHRPTDRRTAVDATDADSDFAGGAAHSGAMIYLGDRWPESFRGSVLMSNIHGRRINLDRLQRRKEDGRFTATHEPDFLRANDPWFRAVSLEYGPDGDVVMTDWSDFGECHDRDGVHRNSGRIYKISYGEPRHVAVDLTRASLEELVALQRHRNDWFARQARRLLQERSAAGEPMARVHTALRHLFTTEPTSAGRLRALWGLHVTAGTDPAWLASQLGDRDEHVRYWAIRLLVDGGPPSAAHATLLARRATVESSWLARMALASALPAIDPPTRWMLGTALARKTNPGDDPNLIRFVWMGWQEAVAAHAQEALELAADLTVPILREWIARRIAEQAGHEPALAGDLVAAISNAANEDVRSAFLAGAAAGLPLRDYALAPEALAPLRRHYDHVQASSRGQALALGATLRDPTAITRLHETLNDPGQPADARSEALRTLAPLRPDWLAADLLRLVNAQQLLEPAIRALAACDDPRVAPALIALYPKLGRAVRTAVIDTLIARPASLRALVEALADRRIAPKDITHSQARQAARAAPAEVRQRFEQLWGRVNSSSGALAAQMKRLRATMKPDFLQLGDRKHGSELFEQRCAVCHSLFGRGGKLAPDLTGSGRKELEYLIVNIVDPNAEIPADWRLAVATLTDGRVVSGSLAAESETSITLQSPEGVTTIERRTLRSLERLDSSLMPTGLLDDLPPDHVRDLFAFLMSDAPVPTSVLTK